MTQWSAHSVQVQPSILLLNHCAQILTLPFSSSPWQKLVHLGFQLFLRYHLHLRLGYKQLTTLQHMSRTLRSLRMKSDDPPQYIYIILWKGQTRVFWLVFFYKKSEKKLGLLACDINFSTTWFNSATNNTWVITDFIWQMLQSHSYIGWCIYNPLTPNARLLSVHRENKITGGNRRGERGSCSTSIPVPLFDIPLFVNKEKF